MAALYGRNGKKLRSRQRDRIDETLTAVVKAEEQAKTGKRKPVLHDDDEWKRIEMEGLTNPDNFDLFLMWYAFGGTERGIGLLELTQLPADTIADFQYILRRLSEIRSIETSDKPS